MRALQVAPRKLPWPGGFLEYTHDKKMGTCCTVKKPMRASWGLLAKLSLTFQTVGVEIGMY